MQQQLTLGVQNHTEFTIGLLPLLFVSNGMQSPGLPTSAQQGNLSSKAVADIIVGVVLWHQSLATWGYKDGINWKVRARGRWAR